MRERRDSLLRCCVSRLLERDWRAKRMLARSAEVVEKLRRLAESVDARSADGRLARDMVSARKDQRKLTPSSRYGQTADEGQGE